MKVLNFGSLNLDYVYEVEHFVRGGETISSRAMNVFCGGKGLNQSVALGRCGVRTCHAGAVGAEDGRMLLEMLTKAGVSTEFVEKKAVRTGHAVIQREAGGENCILLYGGANQTVEREQIDRVFGHFAAGDFLILQNEISEIAYIMEKARELGMKIVLNPSPMDEKIGGYPLECVDYFLLNEVEAAGICGLPLGDAGPDAGESMIRIVREHFKNAVIVLTLGNRGALCMDGDRLYEQPAFPVSAVDTTAAGDTFTGYFIGGIVKGQKVDAALRTAAAASALAVSKPGAAPSIPAAEEVEAFLRTL